MKQISRLLGELRRHLQHSGANRTVPTEEWERIQELFEHALTLLPAQRSTYLRGLPRDDAVLRQEVESLLVAHDREGLLDQPLEDWVEPAKVEEPTPGTMIRQYRISEKLGVGGMGVVYSARDQRLGRDVALKFLSPHLGVHEESKQRFLIEAQAAAALDHPNICTIHEIGETASGQLFIAMPLYGGETLKRRIDGGALPVTEAVDLAIQTARGLAKAHDRGIVHRDIKPANLMLTSDGLLKIVDFGIAKLTDVTITRSGDVHGTIAYMSPEHTSGDAVDGRSDIWSLGVVLYEMLTGERPFRGANDAQVLHAILAGPLPVLQLGDEATALSVNGIVSRMLAREPAHRFAHASDLIRELERYLAERVRRDRDTNGNGAPRPISDEERLHADGERRPATVLVANLSGYAGLVDRLPPEQLAMLSMRIRAAAEEIATRYGGVLNEFREDEIVLLFGVPVACEDHAMRAVRAAIELHERIRAMRQERLHNNPDIRLHTGIGSGPLVARPGDTAGARYQVAGEAARVARRIAAHAAADETWISPECHRTVGPFFDTEARPRITLRERSGSITPRRVVRHTGIASRLDAALRKGLTRYVGRERERDRLENALQTMLKGASQLVVVTGDAGLGKSRLLHEFRTATLHADVQLLTGRCHSNGSRTAYLPFVEVLRACFAVPEDDDPHGVPEKIARRVAEIAPELDEFVPLYLHLLGVSSPDHPIPKHLHGDQLRVAIQEAIAALLTLAARHRPVVLLLEDWHWVDDASHAVLEQLIEVAGDDPLLVVATSRAPLPWKGPIPGHVLVLEPLDAAASEAMLCSIAGADEFPEDIAAVLHARTGGNPFFLEEICHALLEEGTLRAENDVVRLTGPLDALELPDTVQAVIHTRLERLDPDSRELVRLASVIGRQFSRAVLERAMPHAGRLPNALQGLKAAGLIKQVRVVPDALFRFKHVLTQEVAYGSLLEHQRKELHGRVAAAIEATTDGRLHDQLQQLAHHHGRAEHWRRAIEYGLRAADRLHSLSEFAEALQQLERCEEWLERSSVAERVATHVDILLRQERLCETLGLRARQQVLVDRLIALLEPTGERNRLAEVYLRQGDLFTLLRSFDRARIALDNALRLSRAVGDVGAERNTLRSLGLMHWHHGRHDAALRAIEAALALDRERNDVAGIVGDLVGKGAVLKGKGDLEAARMALEEALDLSERELAGDEDLPGGLKLPYILHNLANVYREKGESDRALALLRAALATTQAKHLPVQGSYHSTAIAHILLQQGKVEESVATYYVAVSAARKARYSPGLSQALSALGEVLVGLGRDAEALPHLDEAASLFAQLRDEAGAANTSSLIATAHERLGDPRRARECWTKARESHRTIQHVEGELQALEGIARAAGALGADASEARVLWEAALELALALPDPVAEGRIRNSLGILAWNCGDFDRALREYRSALETFRANRNEAGVGLMLNSIAVTLIRQQRHDDAERTIREAHEVHRRTGNLLLEAHAEAALGEILERRGDLSGAEVHYRTSMRLREVVGDRSGTGWMLHRLALTSARAGALHEARDMAELAGRIAIECGDTELQAVCNAGFTSTD